MAMNFFKSAASAVSAAGKLAAESAKKTYADLKAPPSHVRCSACPLEVPVPPTAFDWSCTAGHVNKRADELCTECRIAQPPNLPEPTVTCATCQAVTTVPSSNARKHAREAATKTKEFAAQTAAATKAGVEHLRAAPTTFHCAHCNTLLAVPTGDWSCQTCTTLNLEDVKTCGQCGQKKSDQKAICGVCRQSTVIPSTNFVDSVKSTVKTIHKSGKKAYFDAAGKPYVSCGKCGFNVAVPHSSVSAGAPVSPNPHAASPSPAAAHAGDAPAEGQPPAVVPGGAVQAPEGTYNGEALICTNCKNPIEH